jgi:hypothetical protein
MRSMVSTGAEQTGRVFTAALDTESAQNVRDRFADEAVEVAASVDQQLTEEEIRQAIENLDARTVRRIVQNMANEDTEGAAQLLPQNTALSEQDSQALVEGTYQELEQQLGDPTNQQPLREDLQNQLAGQVDSYIAQRDAQGRPVVDPS